MITFGQRDHLYGDHLRAPAPCLARARSPAGEGLGPPPAASPWTGSTKPFPRRCSSLSATTRQSGA